MSTATAKKAAKKPAINSSGSRTMAQKVAALNRFREQFNPLKGLRLERAVRLASDYFLGDMADLQWTYFFIEQTDTDLLALLELRMSRLIEMDYHISTEKGADEGLAAEQSAFLEEKFYRIDNLYEAIEHFGYAPFRGYAHCEKWMEGGELVHLEIVDQWNVVRDGLVGGWKYNPDARSTSYRALPEANIMDPANFVVRQVARPINRIALYKFVRANLNECDWDSFNAIYGIPGGVVIGPADVPIEKESEYQAAANEIAGGGSGYLPYGSIYTQNKGPGGTNPFKERLDNLSEKLVLVGTGGKLTMLTESGSGTLAGGAHSDVFDAITAADAVRIGHMFNRQLVKGWLDEGFPGQKQVAYFGLAANEETNVSQIITDIKGLSDAGFEVDEAEASQKTGYTLKRKAAPVFDSGLQVLEGGQPAAIANRARAVAAGQNSIFKANAAAQELAARREVFRPIALRLAAIDALEDAGQREAAVAKFRADSGQLYAAVVAKAPDLAKAAEEAIGTALVAGFTDAARAREAAAPQIQNKAGRTKMATTPRKTRPFRS